MSEVLQALCPQKGHVETSLNHASKEVNDAQICPVVKYTARTIADIAWTDTITARAKVSPFLIHVFLLQDGTQMSPRQLCVMVRLL